LRRNKDNMPGIAVRLPLTRDKQDGFSLLQTYNEVAEQNLKMLVLTCPGERMMDPEFGVGARRFLFELVNEDTFQLFKSTLLQQQEKYLPYLVIEDVQFISSLDGTVTNENFLGIRILYYNKIFKNSGTLSLPIR